MNLETCGTTRQGMAALCLHGQPFGFTKEDVENLYATADEPGNHRLYDLATRIDALLPPRDVSDPRD